MHAEQESNERSKTRANSQSNKNESSKPVLRDLSCLARCFLDVVSSCCGVALWNLSATWLEINPNRNVVGFRLIKKATWLLVGRICFQGERIQLAFGSLLRLLATLSSNLCFLQPNIIGSVLRLSRFIPIFGFSSLLLIYLTR